MTVLDAKISPPHISYNQTRSIFEGLLVKGCIKIDCYPCSSINMLKAFASLKVTDFYWTRLAKARNRKVNIVH
ncbi:hypothetical protein ES288_A10G061900v1 [Gossypium darwinii]|uniref:Uncharacterized protein n=1 Tax=Gossypium darwinii TaxID=34276 RepID=A0A5D2EX47_GOSDA|nr:hypothetical protein ES288_A10G061900v1 [Gossypium darwinii]TYG97742.1 hypothetical protein ES288_A10G061900v1 [Gossypium darwinii]